MIQHEAFLQCGKCGGRPYRIYRRQNTQVDGTPLQTFENVLWPTSPDVPPPKTNRRIECPTCGEELKRA